ncbi:MAG: hypothetical protein AAF127_08865 [Pseudomonadota bacterium]
MTRLESHRAMTVDVKTTYVAISRARHHAAIYTDTARSLLMRLSCVRASERRR